MPHRDQLSEHHLGEENAGAPPSYTPPQWSVRARLTRRHAVKLAAAGAVGSLATRTRRATAATDLPGRRNSRRRSTRCCRRRPSRGDRRGVAGRAARLCAGVRRPGSGHRRADDAGPLTCASAATPRASPPPPSCSSSTRDASAWTTRSRSTCRASPTAIRSRSASGHDAQRALRLLGQSPSREWPSEPQRQWTAEELLAIAFNHPPIFEPGAQVRLQQHQHRPPRRGRREVTGQPIRDTSTSKSSARGADPHQLPGRGGVPCAPPARLLAHARGQSWIRPTGTPRGVTRRGR